MFKKNSYFYKIFSLLGGERKKIPFLIVVFLISSMLDVIGISLIGPYIGVVINTIELSEPLLNLINYLNIPKDRESMLMHISYAILIVFIAKTVLIVWINKVIINFSEDQQMRLRTFLMSSYQSLPYKDYIQRNSAEYIYSIQQLTSIYSGQVVLPILKSFSDGIVAIFILSFLAWQNFYVFLLLIILFGLALFFYDLFFKNNIRDYGEKINIASEKTIKGIHEGIEGFKEIRILGKENYFFNNVKIGAKEQAFFGSRMLFLSSIPRYILELLMMTFVVLVVMAILIFDGNINNLIPTLGIFAVASLRLLPASNTFSSSLMKIRYSRDAVDKLYEDLKTLSSKDKIHSKETKDISSDKFKKLMLKNISFTYPSSTYQSISQISLEINKGDSIGFIGASGSGKTTLIDLILGLLEPQKGLILYNGKEFEDSLNEWRSQIAYLPQQIFLTDSSLKQNVALGIKGSNIDEEKVHKSLKQSRLTDLIEKLSDGINTKIGERGLRLSGGQRQRVALARAFYHEREILIMDEATSALDTSTETEIVEEIKQLKGSKTLIVIAHRLSTLRHCDRIYEIQEGKIVKIGSYEDLID